MRVFDYRRAGAVVVRGDEVLLISMQPPGGSRWWHFPGGGIEDGEDAREAALRELHEETGLRGTSAVEFLRGGIQGGVHHYFLVDCEDYALGAVTGPELEYAADQDFRAEWVPIDALSSMPVFPRCVAEQLERGRTPQQPVPWVEDDRHASDGVPGARNPDHLRHAARAVIVVDGRLAAIRRIRDGLDYFTLPGGGLEPGETPETAVVREVEEELGLHVSVTGRLAVVAVRLEGVGTVQTYLSCRVEGGRFGSGTGDEFTAERASERGLYLPVWIDATAPPPALRPTWLTDRLADWRAAPAPERPERFCEFHD